MVWCICHRSYNEMIHRHTHCSFSDIPTALFPIKWVPQRVENFTEIRQCLKFFEKIVIVLPRIHTDSYGRNDICVKNVDYVRSLENRGRYCTHLWDYLNSHRWVLFFLDSLEIETDFWNRQRTFYETSFTFLVFSCVKFAEKSPVRWTKSFLKYWYNLSIWTHSSFLTPDNLSTFFIQLNPMIRM